MMIGLAISPVSNNNPGQKQGAPTIEPILITTLEDGSKVFVTSYSKDFSTVTLKQEKSGATVEYRRLHALGPWVSEAPGQE